MKMGEPWQNVVVRKITIRDDVIGRHCHNYKPTHMEAITEIDNICDLTQKLDAGDFTAEDVVHAYINQ